MVTVVNTIPHPSVVKEVICRNCGATLQYVPKDIQSHYSRDIDGGGDFQYWINCPPCGNKVTVKKVY